MFESIPYQIKEFRESSPCLRYSLSLPSVLLSFHSLRLTLLHINIHVSRIEQLLALRKGAYLPLRLQGIRRLILLRAPLKLQSLHRFHQLCQFVQPTLLTFFRQLPFDILSVSSCAPPHSTPLHLAHIHFSALH